MEEVSYNSKNETQIQEPPNAKHDEGGGDPGGEGGIGGHGGNSGGGEESSGDAGADVDLEMTDPSTYYRDFHRTMEDEEEEEDEDDDRRGGSSDRALMRSSAPASHSRRPLGLPSIVDTLLQHQHGHPSSLTSSHPPPPSPTIFNPSIPFASTSESLSAGTNFLDTLSHENFQMSIVVQPPLKTVYQRILKPFPSVCLSIVSNNGNPVPDDTICEGLFVEATLLRGDNGVPLPKCIDGNCVVRFERRSRSMNEGLFATFKKLKILSTSQQLQGTLLRLKFTLKKYSGNSFATIQVPNCSVISHPIEVFSHTQYLNKNKQETKGAAPSLPAPVLEYFAQSEERKRQDWPTPVPDSALKISQEVLPPEPPKIQRSVLSVSAPAVPVLQPPTPHTVIPQMPAVSAPVVPVMQPPPKRDMSLDVVRVLKEFKAQGGNYQTAISWVNHVFGVQNGINGGTSSTQQPTAAAPPNGNNSRQGSSFLRSSLDSLATLKSSGGSRTSPAPSASLKSASSVPLPSVSTGNTTSVSLSGAPASSRKRGSALSVSSPSVPVLRKNGSKNYGGASDLSGLEALAATSTQSLSSKNNEIQEDTELVSSLITDLKNHKITWEKFTSVLYDSLGDTKALHVLSSLPSDIHETIAATPVVGMVPPSKPSEKPSAARKNGNKRSLVQSNETLNTPSTSQRGRKKKRASHPPSSPEQQDAEEEDASPPPSEKKLKLSRSQPGIPTKARQPASPPGQPAFTVDTQNADTAPELLLAQLSTYRSSSQSNSPTGGPSSPVQQQQQQQPPSPPSIATQQHQQQPSSSAAAGGGASSSASSAQTPRSTTDPVNRWYWKNDEGWEPYSDEISRELEKAYNQHTVCYIILENVPYKMDFRTMVQIRMDSTKRWRHIKRD